MPTQHILSGQGADFLDVLPVCQYGIKIGLIDFSVGYNNVVDGFAVSVIQITVKLGVLVDDVFTAYELFIIRFVKINSAEL